MDSRLKEVRKGSMKVTSSSTTVTNEEKKSKEVPKGATILRKTVSTNTEEIENGWLITKNIDVKYSVGDPSKGNTDYAYIVKKYYSKDDPLTVTLNDKSLADEFNDV